MINSYYEGYVRARAVDREQRYAQATVIDEIYRPRPSVRYRLGRRLVDLGAQLMGPETQDRVGDDDLRRAA